MFWAQLIVVLFVFFNFGLHCINHGASRGKYSAPGALFDLVIVLVLYYFAGALSHIVGGP